MPIIQCDIRRGRTEEQRRELCSELTRVVHEVTGVPVDYIFMVVREMPGFNFVDAGEHVPDYVPGADGQDVAGGKQIAERQARTHKVAS
jgi:4-oxalocrotonate tautomerase family enzyme